MPGARDAAVIAIADQARVFPRIQSSGPNAEGLDDRDRALAVALYRLTVQRWMTLDYLLSGAALGPFDRFEPKLKAILLVGAAQILFMEKIPDYAVVDVAVDQAREMVRPGAAKLVNAILRRICEIRAGQVHGKIWTIGPDTLPWDDGYVKLNQACLPPIADLPRHLSIATSHPQYLVKRWLDEFELEKTMALLRHNLSDMPICVYTGGGDAIGGEPATVHAKDPNFAIWHGDYHSLTRFLSRSASHWVQDYAAWLPVQATESLGPALIIDFCAGKGTKTRALSALHPYAQVIASDRDEACLQTLELLAETNENLTVKPAKALVKTPTRCDLLLLDVPCSNAAVLARRTEAKYRYNRSEMERLVRVQQRIIKDALPLLAPGGTLVYATCSLMAEENQQQVDWMLGQYPLEVQQVQTVMPSADVSGPHEGIFYAVCRRSA